MTVRILLAAALLIVCGRMQRVQQPRPKAPVARPAPAAKSGDAARKAQILGSEAWRQAMFRMNEGLSATRIYDAQQVQKIKSDFAARVDKMSADELQFTLDDLNAKFQILSGKDAQEARAWLAHYLSILSDKKRAETVKRMPNIATMTAAQLAQLIAQIDEKRAEISEQQSQVQQLRDSAPNPWNQPYNPAQQAYVRDHTMARSAYSSPYRAPSMQKPFEDVKTGPNMQFYSGAYGGFGVIFGN